MDENHYNNVSNKYHLNEIEQEKIILAKLEEELTKNVNLCEDAKQKLGEKISRFSKSSKELLQEKELWNEVNSNLSKQIDELEKIKQHHEKNLSSDSHTINELRQVKFIMEEMNQSMEKTISKLEKSNKEMENKLSQSLKDSKEFEQEKVMLNEIVEDESAKTLAISKKYYLTIALSAVVLAAVIIPYSLYTITLVGQEYRVENLVPTTSGYVIQNLRGDTVDTWISWRLTDGDVLHVNIVNAHKYPEKAEIIKNVVLSKEPIEIDDNLLHKGPKGTTSTYYIGWAGALETASQGSTEFFIPANLEVTDSTSGAGDITIRLVKERNGDGFTGWTSSIIDEKQNQILKSDITIYDVDHLSDSQVETITRHELGHAFGLAHSSDPRDLMYPIIKTEYPYISQCIIDAITALYDGSQKSEVVCEN